MTSATQRVPDGFKKCMRGHCGCGGSNHQRLRISCDDSSRCGPCSYEDEAWGCNLAGSRMWYCDPTTDTCPCINRVFHEMSHACGAFEADAVEIGEWFENEEQCLPPSGAP